jgi:D-sedoheptulose 7-phosphate isomerase
MRAALFPVVIVAGGRATRLGALARDVPKGLVDVAGEPFAFHVLRRLRAAGVEQVLFCVGHLGEQFVDRIGDGRSFGLAVDYVFDGPVLRGTAGAIRHAGARLPARFFVQYGDSYLTCDYAAVQRAFEAAGRLGLMTVFRNENRWDASNVEFDGSRIVAYDKAQPTARMRHIDYGLGVFRKEAFALAEGEGSQELATLYQELLRRQELAALEVFDRFYEIGSPEGLAEMRRHVAGEGFAARYLAEARAVLDGFDPDTIERVATILAETRAAGGRLFVLGVGGSAANAAHAVNDFRKIAGLEAYAPTDNVAELTARTNDDGWASVFAAWLKTSRLGPRDLVCVLSVGGGDVERNVSPNLVAALEHAQEVGARVVGIVGRDGGYTARVAEACVIVPTVNPAHTTPHTEAFQAVICHLLVSHPVLKASETKWESVR